MYYEPFEGDNNTFRTTDRRLVFSKKRRNFTLTEHVRNNIISGYGKDETLTIQYTCTTSLSKEIATPLAQSFI